MSGGNHWTVTCRAVATDGASPDKFCAIAVPRAMAASAAQAIHAVQTRHMHIIRRQLPNRAFVDWQATDGPAPNPDANADRHDEQGDRKP